MDALYNVVCCPQVAIAVAVVIISLYLVSQLFCGGRVQNLDNKYVLITGCDTGFGKMAAIRLDQLGFHVIATCLTNEGEKEVKKEASNKLTTFRLDVTKSDQIQDVYRKVNTLIPLDKGKQSLLSSVLEGR